MEPASKSLETGIIYNITLESAYYLEFKKHIQEKQIMKCTNCETFGHHGNYCASCGQKLNINLTPKLKDAIHDGIHEFLHLDGKIFNTLKSLFMTPGFLTVEYLRGRRVSYINPIRVYLTMSILYFLFTSLNVFHNNGFFRINTDQSPAEQMEQPKADKENEIYFFGLNVDKHFSTIKPVFDRGIDRMEADNGKEFKKIFSSTMGKVLFLLLPIFALILYFSFIKLKNKTYLPFLYFSLHFHAALFGGLLLTHFLEIILGSSAILIWLVWTLVYLFLSIRRVWKDSYKTAMIRTMFTLFSYGIIFIIMFSVIAVLSAYKIGLEA